MKKPENKYLERLYNGIIKENPTLVLMLGMCPTLAVSTSATNGIGMGLSTLAVLIASNFIISLLRKVIPDEVRLPAYIVIVASLVTVVELLIEAFVPTLYDALGIYIPLIVVNCIILGRAEAYANKHAPLLSIFDGLGMGLGFTISLTILGLIRELIGAGTAFGVQVMPASYNPIGIFVKAPGAFMVIAFMVMIMNAAGIHTRQKELVSANACDEGCAVCQDPAGCGTAAKAGEGENGTKNAPSGKTAAFGVGTLSAASAVKDGSGAASGSGNTVKANAKAGKRSDAGKGGTDQ